MHVQVILSERARPRFEGVAELTFERSMILPDGQPFTQLVLIEHAQTLRGLARRLRLSLQEEVGDLAAAYTFSFVREPQHYRYAHIRKGKRSNTYRFFRTTKR